MTSFMRTSRASLTLLLLLLFSPCDVTAADKSYIFYDVFSTSAPRDVKAALGDIPILQSFKIVGVTRYLFLIEDDGSEKVRGVMFPNMTAMNYHPVRSTRDFLKTVNVTSGWEEPSTLSDKDLMFIKWEFPMPSGTSLSSFGQKMKAWGEVYKNGFANTKALSLSRWAYIPQRIVTFVNLPYRQANDAVFRGLDTVGGAASAKTYIKRAVNI